MTAFVICVGSSLLSKTVDVTLTNSIINLVSFSTNFVPFHLKETTQSITQIVRILTCHILHYHQTSMATPKDTNDHFP